MKLAANAWSYSFMFAVLVFLPSSASAGMVEELKAFEGYKALALKGDPVAQTNLGGCYFLGKGVAQDDVEAVKWYRKAVDQGNAIAQSSLGFCYERGRGVAKDQVEAVKLYRKAADQGNALAQYFLAVCYADGKGVAKDDVEAVKWLRKAADQGDASCQYILGYCYERGKGVVKDDVEAYAYYNLAGITIQEARKKCDAMEKALSPEAILRGQQRSTELQKEIDAKKAEADKLAGK